MSIGQPNPIFAGYSSFGQNTPKMVTVTSTSLTLLNTNADRVIAKFTNNGSEPIWLGQGIPAVVGQGQRVSPGATFAFDAIDLYTGTINGVCESGSVAVWVIEGVV